MLQYLAHLIALSAVAPCLIGCQSQIDPAPMGSHQESSPKTAAQQYREVIVDAACGQCQFGLPGSSCDLAVRIDGASYFVDGTGIDDHGDAHSSDGVCNAVRSARVSGQIQEGRFVATHFEVLPGTSE